MIDPKEAAKELLKRRKARKEFYSFCKYIDCSFFTENKQHLKIIAGKLQEVSEGKIKKLIISLPPRSGKSYIVSLWCAWTIGRNPKGSIMRNSYAAELAEKFSYDIRDIIKSDKYQRIFPVKLKQDKQKINDWAIEGAVQSSYFCAGVGGAITGKGCTSAAILDDPIKNIEDALSETIINKTWQWYTSTHKSRLEKGCPEIIIATRWSRRDPTGMVLETQPGQWEEINFPALVNGQTFCDEIKTTDEFLEIKQVTDDFIWEAEYMQNPVEAKGLLFPIEELNRFSLSELHDTDAVIGYTDTADEGTDFLCSVIAKIKGKNAYITDVVFTQDPIEVTEPLVAQQIIEHQPNKHTVESNNGGKSFAKNVEKLIKDDSRTVIKWIPTTQNKETRILMKSGQVKKYFWFRNDYPLGSPYDKYMRQLTSYVKMGKNKHDDAADGTTGLAEQIFKEPSIGILK